MSRLRPYGMVKLMVTPEAFDAVAATLPDRPAAPSRDAQGLVPLWIDIRTADSLAALRGPSEGYSEVILKLAKMEVFNTAQAAALGK